MKTYYLLANGQPNDRAVYYTGKYSFHGGEFWGNVEEAYYFESLENIFEYIRHEGCTAAPIIVQMPECTKEVIERGYNDYRNSVKSTDREVYHKFNTVSYITNSRPY